MVCSEWTVQRCGTVVRYKCECTHVVTKLWSLVTKRHTVLYNVLYCSDFQSCHVLWVHAAHFFIAVIRRFFEHLSRHYKSKAFCSLSFCFCCSDLPLYFTGMSITTLKLWTQKNLMYFAQFGRSRVSSIVCTVWSETETYSTYSLFNCDTM